MSVVLFAGGGTGGHLMPALAIADAMVDLDHTIEPYFVGAIRGIEAKVLPSRPWRYTLLPFEPLYRRQWWLNYRLPLSLLWSFRGIREILRRENPVLAVGTGGYASGPALWAAAGRGIPTVVQEQNAYPGLATRKLAPKASQIHLGFPEARAYLKPGPNTRVLDTGNPIPPPPAVRPAKGDAKTAAGFDPARPLVLVTGGSQGALGLNVAVAELLAAGWPEGVQLYWQTGVYTLDQFAALKGRLPAGSIRIEGFIDPMAAAWAAADLVVGRGGASTFAAIAAWGLPSILVPLPTSAANHQLANARALHDAGAAILLEQHLLSGNSLGASIRELLASPDRMAAIAAAATLRARPQAASEIAREVLRLLSKS